MNATRSKICRNVGFFLATVVGIWLIQITDWNVALAVGLPCICFLIVDLILLHTQRGLRRGLMYMGIISLLSWLYTYHPISRLVFFWSPSLLWLVAMLTDWALDTKQDYLTPEEDTNIAKPETG